MGERRKMRNGAVAQETPVPLTNAVWKVTFIECGAGFAYPGSLAELLG